MSAKLYSRTTTDFQMEKLVQMPSLRFFFFLFWKNLLAENCILAELFKFKSGIAARPEDVT